MGGPPMDDIRRGFARIRYREHAIVRLQERGITVAEIREVVESATA